MKICVGIIDFRKIIYITLYRVKFYLGIIIFYKFFMIRMCFSENKIYKIRLFKVFVNVFSILI